MNCGEAIGLGPDAAMRGLADKWAVSRRRVPSQVGDMLRDRVPQKARRVLAAMLQRASIDMHALPQASVSI
jgi:hypothetical protein